MQVSGKLDRPRKSKSETNYKIYLPKKKKFKKNKERGRLDWVFGNEKFRVQRNEFPTVRRYPTEEATGGKDGNRRGIKCEKTETSSIEAHN